LAKKTAYRQKSEKIEKHALKRSREPGWRNVLSELYNIKQKIKELLITTLQLQIHVEDIGDDIELVGGGLFLESYASMQLIIKIEEEFSIAFDNEDLSFANINSIESESGQRRKWLSMRDEKILSMQYPIITSYPLHADFISCLSQYESALQWFMNYYIQLFAGKDLNFTCFVDFYVPQPWKCCPWLHFQRINKEMIQLKWERAADFFIDCIDRDYYIFLYADRFYIPGTNVYMKAHYPHETFIFGYNRNNNSFSLADFYQNSKYGFETIDFGLMEQAFKNADPSLLFCDLLEGIILIKPVECKEYFFDINAVIDSFNDYLFSRNNSKSYTYGYRKDITEKKDLWVFGLAVYELMMEYLSPFINTDREIDIRAFQIQIDHKTMMLARIKYLCEKKYIKDSSICENFEEIKMQLVSLRNMLIKMILSKNRNLAKEGLDLLATIAQKEKTATQKIIGLLS
jgi:acyl carrier protein